LDPGRYDYPTGVPLIHYYFYRTLLVPFAILKNFFLHPPIFKVFLTNQKQFWIVSRNFIFGRYDHRALSWSRHLTALLGTGAVFLTYLLGKKLLNKTTGLIAAFLVAFNYRHVLSSHLALSDIPNNFFALLAVYACLLLLEKNNHRRYLLAGLSCGFSLSIKYQVFPLLTFLFVQLVWVYRKKSWRELFNKNFVLAVFLIPLLFVLLNPYLFLHFEKALNSIRLVSLRYGMGDKRFNFYTLFYLYHWGIGHLPALAIIGGLVLTLILKPLQAFFLFSFIFPFLFIFVYYARGGTYVRNFTTVIPFLFILAGFLLAEFFQLVKRRWKKAVFLFLPLFLFIVFLVNFQPIKNSVALAYFYTQPWNSDEFSFWLLENLPKKIQVRSHPLVFFPEGKQVERTDWPLNGDISLAEVRGKGDKFAIMNLDIYHVLLYDWFLLPTKAMFKYSDVPYEVITNTYSGLVLEEWLNFTVGEVFNPWQAYDFNYLVFKISPVSISLGNKAAGFNFDKNDDDWQVKDILNQKTENFVWSEVEGRTKKGSLEISQETKNFPVTYFASLPLSVKAGKHYTFSAWIKNSLELELKGNQDGFLRMDFYKNKEDAQEGRNRLGVAVSGRVSGKSRWVEKQASGVAPLGAKYVILGFQRNKLTSNFSSWLDDASLFESDVLPQENFPQVPYIQPKTPKEVLYPNSIL